MCNCCIKASVHHIRLFSITMKSCTKSYKLRSDTILRLSRLHCPCACMQVGGCKKIDFADMAAARLVRKNACAQ